MTYRYVDFLRDEPALRCIVWGNVRGVVRKEVQQIEGVRGADRVGKEKFSRVGVRARVARAPSNSNVDFLLSQVSHS